MKAKKTIIEIAQERGSAAKTRAGAWKYLLANLGEPHPGLLDTERPDGHAGYGSRYRWYYGGGARWTYRMPGSAIADRDYREARMERRADGRALILGYSLDDPNTPGRILEEAWEMNRRWDADCRIAIQRDAYGAILRNTAAEPANRPRPDNAGWCAAWELIGQAVKQEAIPSIHDSIEFDRKGRADGLALHHDLYDFRPDAAIVCIRRTEGTRYGVKTYSKSYRLIERVDGKITAREISIPVAKYAKMPILHYGDIIAIARGEKKITMTTPGQLRRQEQLRTVHRGYKAVAISSEGRYVSVWDGSPWDLGQARAETARDGHDGGLYYYRDYDAMVQAAQTNSIFGAGREHHRLAVLEVEATGIHVSYGAKLAASKITPRRQIASII
jgi:hypothetical protein